MQSVRSPVVQMHSVNLYSRTRQKQSTLVLINKRNSAVPRDSTRSRGQRANTRDLLKRPFQIESSLKKYCRIFSAFLLAGVGHPIPRGIGKHYSGNTRMGHKSAAN